MPRKSAPPKPPGAPSEPRRWSTARRPLWPLGLYRVAGDSMRPAYRPGDLLLGWRWAWRPRPGRVVVAVSPDGRPLVKRLAPPPESAAAPPPAPSPDAAPPPAPGLWLLGDNLAASTDSRHFGALPPAALHAVILCRLASASGAPAPGRVKYNHER